jgi:hypothetical protein
MPIWLSEVLKLMGLTTPFVYAAAAYGFFHYLDKKASGPAKKAISGWLQPKEYDKTAVANAMVELFDRLYTTPLLGWRAFRRSALFTLCMSLIFLYEFSRISEEELIGFLRSGGLVWIIPISNLLVNILSDYGGLFIIKRFLILGGRRPIIASLLGPLVGITIVFLAFVIMGVLLSMFNVLLPVEEFDIVERGLANVVIPVLKVLVNAAFVVHMWLPLFALCVILLRGLNYFRRAVGRTQWFLKSGREHPLDAIGYVGAGLGFIATVVIQHIA